jgi:hypothetical protein
VLPQYHNLADIAEIATMKLSEIVPWGRSLAEYQLMFALAEIDLPQEILGCGDEPASFNFELCLCSHLLFLYSEQLSLEFHWASINELLRVASEVRIFPLLQLNCEPSPYLDAVIQEFSDKDYNVLVLPVEYEFQRGGNQMLKISKS